MKWIVDAQLPPALAAALRNAGYDAVAVREIGLREAKDAMIWQFALQTDAAILTKDEDFAERCLHTVTSPVVIWLRVGNVNNPKRLDWFLRLMPAVVARVESGDRLIEVR